MNSFFPDAVASWNIFIKHFDDVTSFDILKKHINTFFDLRTIISLVYMILRDSDISFN